VLALCLGLAGRASAIESPTGAEPVTAHIAALLTAGDRVVVDGRTLDGAALRPVYEARGYEPLWAAASSPGRAKEVLAAVDRARAHGLDPAAYHQRALQRRSAGTGLADRAAFDVLATDAVIRLGTHLRQGAVRPERVEKDASLAPRPVDPQTIAGDAAAAVDLPGYLDGLAPQTPTYRGLMDALSRYRAIAAAGGWPAVPLKGAVLEPGSTDPTVPAVRARLAATGDHTASEADGAEPTRYDDELVAAVKRFQSRSGLAADGVVGPSTRAALAEPVTERIKQLVANLERLRWLPEDLGRRYVTVNVPSFELVLVQDGNTVLTMPVVVGRKDRRTPMLATQITELVFNPTWTVPPTLLREDFLPKMKRNQSYATARGLRVIGTRNPTLRQPPGPRNPLGRVKFNMPNGFAVYLHDTTAKGLMRAPQRMFSSGCVRLGDAMGLANQLLADDPRWTPATRRSYLSGWTTRSIALREPVPVYLKYQTAWSDERGELQFRDDVYGRDAVLSRALVGDGGRAPPA
jgi:murein L,D-transpeptidase YcbB/YkuD